MSRWWPVNTKVDATIGPVLVRLAPYEEQPSCDGENWDKPWAWLALCRVTFRFGGDLVTTKKITARYRYLDRLGWPTKYAATDDGGRDVVIARIRALLDRMGLDAADLEVVEES